MNPTHDIVLSLLEAPFSRRSEVEKRQILRSRPTPKLTAIFSEKRVGRENRERFRPFGMIVINGFAGVRINKVCIAGRVFYWVRRKIRGAQEMVLRT